MKILHLEDCQYDATIVRRLLVPDWPDCTITVVSTRDSFLKALAEGSYDVVLSDFTLPGFDGLEALDLVRELSPATPFIFCSGTMEEKRAIKAVRAGAADYVLKDRLERLPISIQRVMREREEHRDRRRVEEALAHEQYLLHAVLENLPDHVYFKDANSHFITVSRSFAGRHRLTPAELKGKNDFDIFSEEHARQAFEDEQRIIRTRQPLLDVEEKETWPDQSITWVLTSKLPLLDASGNVVGTFGISHDITARKQAEEHIREQAEVIAQTPLAIVIIDLTHRVSFCNAGAAQLYGISREELLGRAAEDIFTAETMARFNEARLATFTKGRWTGEIAAVTKAGRQIQAEFHMSLIHDSAGRPKARLSIAIDIAEKKKLEEQVLRAQRLESLGMLAAGIAHDLNNILAPVLMGAPLLRGRATHPSDLQVLETIESSAVRGAALVRQILSFAHGTGGEKSIIQVKHLLHDITDLIEETFPKSVMLKAEIANNLWTVQGNPTQIHQVLLNLCVNARDAMPRGGTLSVHAENRILDGPALQSYPGTIPGPHIVLEVADTGTGIPPEVLARIWDPFFTTKGEGKGTGLGLATVRGIVANHGGFVTVDSKPGCGSSFSVFLPATEPSASLGISTVSVHPFFTRGQGELVLVVDDEVSIRGMITVVLSRCGYRVIAAANGVEAMGLYVARMAEVALVVTDLSMPEMGGSNLFLALFRLNPAVKILFMSGGTEGVDKLVPASARILAKPFTAEKLRASVHEALEALA